MTQILAPSLRRALQSVPAGCPEGQLLAGPRAPWTRPHASPAIEWSLFLHPLQTSCPSPLFTGTAIHRPPRTGPIRPEFTHSRGRGMRPLPSRNAGQSSGLGARPSQPIAAAGPGGRSEAEAGSGTAKRSPAEPPENAPFQSAERTHPKHTKRPRSPVESRVSREIKSFLLPSVW